MKNLSRLFALASLAFALCLLACARQTAVKNTNTQKPEEKPSQTEPTGAIEITSAPSGAQVILIEVTESGAGEPKPRGATPTTINLAPGKYTVHLEKTGYKFFQKEVTVKENQTVKVAATLRKQ
ncbi:MAG: PEGA domain-containing protein [Acidobacteriota bacterium]